MKLKLNYVCCDNNISYEICFIHKVLNTIVLQYTHNIDINVTQMMMGKQWVKS